MKEHEPGDGEAPSLLRLSLALGLVASPWVATTLKGRLCDCLAKWECARVEDVGLPDERSEEPCEARSQVAAKVPRGVAIPAERQQGIVDFLMAWIEREMGN